MKKIILDLCKTSLVVCAAFTAQDINAESKWEPILQGDLVSSYVWRGMYQTGASFQPTLGVAYDGLSLTAWGSTDFDGAASSDGRASKEVDLTLAYASKIGLDIYVTDYWWDGQNAAPYFNYSSHTTGHHFEATLAYTLPVEKFPLAMAWSTMFAGNDYNDDGKHAYSSYFRLSYPFAVKRVDFELALGMSPYKSQQLYGCNGFAVTECAAKGSYTIHAGKHIDLPIFSQLVFNPRASDTHIVFGISIVPVNL